MITANVYYWKPIKLPPGQTGVSSNIMGKQCLILLLSLLLITACGKREARVPGEQILVKVSDRVITKDEFIRRAEYTIRPNYCQLDNYIHKKIILNSLIAEKLLSLEAGTTNELARNDEFQKYIRGRQEQAMRQYYYYEKACKKFKLDSTELQRVYQLAGRTYKIQYLRLPNEEAAAMAYHLYKNEDLSFAEIAQELLPDSEIPTREIGFNAELNDDLFRVFFSKPLQSNQILDPVKIDDGTVLMIKVKGWENELLLTDLDIRKRMENVREKLRSLQANQIYTRHVAEIMKGKTLEFNRETFSELTRILAPRYLKSMQAKEDAFNRQFWGRGNEVELDSNLGETIGELRNKPLFTLDGKSWTVAELEALIASHPLVFRKRQISRREFPQQFRFAIADLIRDYFITQAAYEAGYDKNVFVSNYKNMWYDSMISIYWRNHYLEESGYAGDFQKEYLTAIGRYLNPWIDSLQTEYSAEIEINTELFVKIELTRIDLFAVQGGVPYPIVSPGFPYLTTDHKLDYGKKLEIE